MEDRVFTIGSVIDALFWNWIGFFYYKSFAFISLGQYSGSQSQIILALCLLITSGFGMLIHRRHYLSTKSVFANIFIGLGVYTILAYRDYYTRRIEVILLLFLVFAVFEVWYIFTRKAHGQTLMQIQDKDKQWFLIKKRSLRALNAVSLLAGLMMAVLIVPIAYNHIIHGGIIYSSSAYSSSSVDNNYVEDEFSLTNNIESIQKIRSKESWEPLNVQEKIDVLQDVCNCEANYFGLDFTVSIAMNELEEDILGEYSYTERLISIDKQHLEESSPEDVLNTVLHEMYHAYEFSLVDLYIQVNDSQKKMIIFNHCEEYIREMENYKDAGEGESFLSYYCQYMEVDSRSYAEQAVQVYYEQIDTLLKENAE